jgi:hypothetical protein
VSGKLSPYLVETETTALPTKPPALAIPLCVLGSSLKTKLDEVPEFLPA